MNRVVPVLLLHEGLLVKTERFKKPRYVGDPVNAVRIFNEKEVDELVVLDMDPCRTGASMRLGLLEELASEAFMPVAYGGGVDTLDKARAVVNLGIEKVVINSAWATSPELVTRIASVLGSQAVVGGVDVARKRRVKMAMTHGGRRSSGMSALEAARSLVAQGVGEIFLNNIDRDGTMSGFDLESIVQVSEAVPVPVLACGGAGNLVHLEEGLRAGASAVAAGSMFVFHGKHRAVLITYPSRGDISRIMKVAD